MVSIDLKDTNLQIPVHLESRRYLRFVASGGPISSRPSVLVCRQHHRSSQGSWLQSHHFFTGCSHFALSGRLADPRLVVFGGCLGKGHRTSSLSSTRHCDKRGQVSLDPITIGNIPRYGHPEPVFQGFPNSGLIFCSPSQGRRISVLQ